MAQLIRTLMHPDGKIYFGTEELSNLCWTLIRVYQYRNSNQDPKAIVFPYIEEVGGIKIEFAKAIMPTPEFVPIPEEEITKGLTEEEQIYEAAKDDQPEIKQEEEQNG